MGNAKVKNVVIPFIEVEDADEAWIQTSTARVLKNESYKVNKVGVQIFGGKSPNSLVSAIPFATATPF